MSRVDRVHVRCRGPQSRARAALALRERLAATARTHLPGALEHRLGGGRRRVFVERVGHRLDFDPGVYDDVTVATLWADAIAREVARAGADDRGVRVFADDESFAAAAVLEVARRGKLPWWFEELPCGAGRVPPLLVLAAFGEPAPARAALRALAARPVDSLAFVRRLEPHERSLLRHVLEGTLAWGTLGLSPTAARAAVVEAAAAAAPGPRAPAGGRDGAEPHAPASPHAHPRPRRLARSPRAFDASSAPTVAHLVELLARAAAADFALLRFDRPAATDAPSGHAPADAQQRSEAAARVRTEPEAAEAAAEPASSPGAELSDESLAWWTTAGGLVYLYPWLGDLLEGHEVRERLWLLGVLVEPEAEPPLVDPFVRLLAGCEPVCDERPLLADEDTRAAYAAQAEALLASFAALLPGFERSSAAYLRANVVRLGGLLEPLADGTYRLTLEPAPLDPVLERLPYPLAAFRLPWAPLVQPERRCA